MLQGLDSCGSLGRVPLAHGSHEIDCIRTSIGYELLQWRGREVREAELHLACQLHALRPGLLCWSPHHAADLVDLISLHPGHPFKHGLRVWCLCIDFIVMN